MSEGEFQQFVVEQFGKVAEQFDKVDEQFALIREDVKAIRSDISEIQGTLKPLVEAFDKDAETLVEHEARIQRLEKHARLPAHT